jgi:uroporphyrinogen decarboxylase
MAMVTLGMVPDRVPVTPMMTSAARRVYGVTYAEWAQDGELAAKCLLHANELFGFDGLGGFLDLSVEAGGFGQEIIYPIEDTPHPNYDNLLIRTPDDYPKIEHVDPKKAPRMKEVIKMCDILMNERGTTQSVNALVYGPLSILGMLAGAQGLLRHVKKYREEVIKGLEIVTEVMIEYIKAIAETKVHGIMFDTLYASQSIMSKKMWLETEGPFIKQMAEACRDCGMAVSVHNCGNGPYMDAMIETMNPGTISIANLPEDCQNWTDVKEKWGSRVTLMGAVDPTQFCFLGNPDQVKAECKRFIEMMGKNGRYILAPGCEFPPNGPLLNVKAMVEASEHYGKYSGT